MGAVVSNERNEFAAKAADAPLNVVDPAECVSSEHTAGGEDSDSDRQKCGNTWSCWIKRFGIAGFAFFFIKGLLWLAIGAVIWFMRPGAAG